MVGAENSGQEKLSERKESRTFLNIKHTVLSEGKYFEGSKKLSGKVYLRMLMSGLNRTDRVGIRRHQLQFMEAVMMELWTRMAFGLGYSS